MDVGASIADVFRRGNKTQIDLLICNVLLNDCLKERGPPSSTSDSDGDDGTNLKTPKLSEVCRRYISARSFEFTNKLAESGVCT